MNERRRSNRRTADHLLVRRPVVFSRKRQLDRPSRGCRSMERLNDLDIDQAFQTGGFRLLVVENTIGKIDQFGRKLIAAWKPLCLDLTIDCQAMYE